MGIKLFVVRFHQKTCIFVVISIFVCSLSQSIIDYACPNFQATSEMAPHHEFELSMVPSIPSKGLVGGLC